MFRRVQMFDLRLGNVWRLVNRFRFPFSKIINIVKPCDIENRRPRTPVSRWVFSPEPALWNMAVEIGRLEQRPLLGPQRASAA